jgi:hypothetical protein
MKLMTLAEFARGGKPDPSAVREWLRHPVTERMFNHIFHVVGSASPDPRERIGAVDCRDAILRLFMDAEDLLIPVEPKKAPEPDYNSDEYVKARREQLGIKNPQ